MLPIKIIVHPTDFSENSQAGFELACAVARDYRARLYVVHVAPIPTQFAEFGALPPRPINRKALERQLAQFQPPFAGVEITHALLEGDAASEITAFAMTIEADVIVMGTHGRTGLSRMVMGSVAEEVLRRARCPVVTIKNPLAKRNEEPANYATAASA